MTDFDRLTGKRSGTEQLNKFVPRNVRSCTAPWKKWGHLLFMFSCRGVKSFVKPLTVPLTLSL